MSSLRKLSLLSSLRPGWKHRCLVPTQLLSLLSNPNTKIKPRLADCSSPSYSLPESPVTQKGRGSKKCKKPFRANETPRLLTDREHYNNEQLAMGRAVDCLKALIPGQACTLSSQAVLLLLTFPNRGRLNLLCYLLGVGCCSTGWCSLSPCPCSKLVSRLQFVAGISLNAGYRKIDNDAIDDDELDAAALQIYIAAGVYCACVLGCGARWYYVTFYNPAPPKPRRFGQSEDV